MAQIEMTTLERERDATQAEIKRLQTFLKVELDEADDEVDSNVAEREKILALIQTLERKVESIEHAMNTARKGTYGICEICGQPIDPERLELLPHTTLCVRCKQAQERAPRNY
jgi:DnaK suppressor protein